MTPDAFPAGVSVVVITRDRRGDLHSTLDRLTALPDADEVIVVDKGSSDGTATAVREACPQLGLIEPGRNLGAPGRTLGVRAAARPVVAFAGDDSWWEPGAGPRGEPVGGARTAGAALWSDHRRARGCHRPGLQHDGSRPPGSGPAGSLRARAPRLRCHRATGGLSAVGGYSSLLHFGGEERLLSVDLAVGGWQQCYVDTVVAHHAPSPRRGDWSARWAPYRRNDTLTAVLRLPGSRGC